MIEKEIFQEQSFSLRFTVRSTEPGMTGMTLLIIICMRKYCSHIVDVMELIAQM